MALETSGQEKRYRFELDEKWPDVVALVEVGDDQIGTRVPEKLVKAHEKARDALRKAEDDLTRWVKYADPVYAETHIPALVDQLGPAERAKR